MEEDTLSFEDGVLICKHIFQCAIHKTLHGVPEEWEIFQKTHEMLGRLEEERKQEIITKLEKRFDKKRLDDLLFKFNIEDIYATI